MTHSDMSENATAKAGISDDPQRVSVGLEGENDPIADLRQARDSSQGEPIPLCRYEEQARTENRLRAARRSAGTDD